MAKEYETADTMAVVGRGPDAVHSAMAGEKQGTVSDVENMKRLGKEQLFRVSAQKPCSRACLIVGTEELRFLEYLWLCYDSDEYMASSSRCGCLRFGQRRLCWSDIHVYHRHRSIRHHQYDCYPGDAERVVTVRLTVVTQTFRWLRWRQWRLPLVHQYPSHPMLKLL
jgi:hypothetical protein